MKDLLPIGSVVKLKNGVKSLMIIGWNQIKEQTTRYDYVGVLHPEGHLNKNSFFLFNQEDIEEIKFIGYVNTEAQIFRQKAIEAEKEANNNGGE